MENITDPIKISSNIQLLHNADYAGVYLTKITSRDKKLLQKTVAQFRPDSKNYEDSWGYIIQATRYGGFKWYDKSNNYLIFFSKKSDNDATLVVPVFFAPFDYLRQVVEKVQILLKVKKTILKNVNVSDAGSLIETGFRKYRDDEIWNQEARFDDQTFPQLIVDLKKFSQAQGRYYHILRKALNKCQNYYIRNYLKTDKDIVLNIFSLKDNFRNERKDIIKGMYFSSHAMYPNAEVEKFVIIDKQTKQIVGFTATSDISSEITSLVAGLFRPGVKNVSIWGMYQTLLIKYKQGFKFANLGGSEHENTYKFKKEKFCPIKELKKTHLVFDRTS